MPALSQPMARPLRTIVWLGIGLGLLLGAGLVVMLANDYQRRLEAAQRQSTALATGSQRLLRLELRNLERAMRGIAADGAQLFEHVPAQAPDLLDEAIDGVLQRHAELESIVVVDQFGRALTSGGGDLTLPLWAVEAHRGQDSQLYLGPPQDLGMRRWVLQLALRMGEDRWLLSRLHTSELQSIISGLDIGLHGVLSISDVTGHLLARSPDNDGLTGQQFKLQRRDLLGSDTVLPLGVEHSPIDKSSASPPSPRWPSTRWRCTPGWAGRMCWRRGGPTCRPRSACTCCTGVRSRWSTPACAVPPAARMR